MNKFIFDVDGTLTPSRQVIDTEFKEFFLQFIKDNKVWLVTGSDYAKTVEQLGTEICESVVTSYNCSGNDVWFKGKRVHTSDWMIGRKPFAWLEKRLSGSKFPYRTGQHYEHRPGMMNFSIVGRNANLEQRAEYVAWDTKTGERDLIAEKFNEFWPELEARPGGETGIDIGPKGSNKSKILQDFDEHDSIIFFGDRMDEKGNDFPLADANKNGLNYHVKDWKETWKILQENYI